MCIKTDTEGGEKTFVNLCHSDKLPAPPRVSDAVLAEAIATMDNTQYSIPVSLGQPHAELDNAGKGCTAYDIIVATEVFEQLTARHGMLEFVIELAFCLIEQRHNIALNRSTF